MEGLVTKVLRVLRISGIYMSKLACYATSCLTPTAATPIATTNYARLTSMVRALQSYLPGSDNRSVMQSSPSRCHCSLILSCKHLRAAVIVVSSFSAHFTASRQILVTILANFWVSYTRQCLFTCPDE